MRDFGSCAQRAKARIIQDLVHVIQKPFWVSWRVAVSTAYVDQSRLPFSLAK